MTIIEQSPLIDGVPPQYDLDANAREELFIDAVRNIGASILPDHTNVLVLPTDAPLANYVRSVEAEILPTVPGLMANYESFSRFVVTLQDAPDGVEHTMPAHASRIHRVRNTDAAGLTGLPTFDDALKSGLVTEHQLLDYYDVKSLSELGQQYINVESNIDIIPRSMKAYSGLGYRAIFELVRMEHLRGVVAYQNRGAMKSLDRMGLIAHPLVGDPTLSVVDEDKAALDKITQDGDEVKNKEQNRYYPLTVESVPWSKLTDGSATHNFDIFTNPDYAKSKSRIAGMVALKPLHVINML